MSAPYVPDGQTPPVPSYTLPQDVVDDVVVETVNTPFTTAADNIAWMLLAFTGRIANPRNFGAVGDGVTDDTVAIQDAIDYLEGLGGGLLYVDLDTYRYTDTLTVPATVSVYFEPGAVFQMHHATRPSIEIGPGDQITDAKATWDNVRLEASSLNNSGLVLGCPIGPGLVTFRNMVINANGNYESQLWRPDGAAYCIFENCQAFPNMADSVPIRNDAGSFRWTGGRIKPLNVNFNDALVAGSAGDRIVEGCVFDVSACTDGNAVCFAANSGSTSMLSDCKFIGEASQENVAVSIADGAVIQSSGHSFGELIPYTASGTAAEGSHVELLPSYTLELPGTVADIPAYYASVAINCGAGSPPTLTMLRPLTLGQTVDIAVKNDSGDAWAGNIDVTNGTGVDGIVFTSSGPLTDLAEDGFATLRFVAQKFGTDLLYVQIGAAGAHFQA